MFRAFEDDRLASGPRPDVTHVEVVLKRLFLSIEEWKPQVIVLPIPVPIFVPVPMHLYCQKVPVPFSMPIPVSVLVLPDQSFFNLLGWRATLSGFFISWHPYPPV